MQYWDHIIHAALLGTDKRALTPTELPPGLAEAATLVQQNTTIDKEEQFLQTIALAFNYRQCGVMPLQKEGITTVKAGEEEKQYGNAQAMQTLKDILDIESHSLLRLWLQHCAGRQRIVVPELVPVLLHAGVQYKTLRTLATTCCGKRGEWLSKFNNEWYFPTNAGNEELWQTGSPDQRKAVLQQLRQTNPAQARNWLQQTWPQEDANTKQELLSLLATNIGEEDISFLESLESEKSKKVKELALRLLKQIPGSPVVQQYQQVLQQAVHLKKEKTLLGLSQHTTLTFQLPATINEAVFKTGIEKLSSSKEFTDDEFMLYQLVQSTPPVFWETHLQLSPADIIQLWQKEATGKKLLPALVNAVTNFKCTNWAIAFMQNSNVFYIDIIPLLPSPQQELYSIKFMDQFAGSIIEYAVNFNNEWSVELTRAIFKHAAKEVYQYNKAFFNRNIHLIPAAIVPHLDQLAPPEEHLKSQWRNTSEYISRLLHLKTQTIQSFNE
jgi:hypothetical protein